MDCFFLATACWRKLNADSSNSRNCRWCDRPLGSRRKISEYVLGHHLKGEGKRLALMSELLDPMHRRYIESLDVVKPGARTLEVGCGNGSISAWLAERVSPGGKAVAFDLDLSLVTVRAPNLELR